MADSFDVIVIGGGPAGYPTAIRAAQNGLSVACIDEWKNHDGSAAFGGTCLNAGCIPSKALLESTELYHRLREEFAVHGIRASGVELDLPVMQRRRAGIVKKMTDGIASLFKAGGVTPLQGHGKLLPDKRVEFTAHDGSRRELTAKHVVLASRVRADRAEGRAVRWQAHHRLVGCARARRGAEAARGHRGRRDRAGARERLAAPRERGRRARGAR